ncbi:MAG: site-specific integrase [Sedimentisphaerales bacterium]|nr:site-specific integrase [Sedimentisphaerales bacterium]
MIKALSLCQLYLEETWWNYAEITQKTIHRAWQYFVMACGNRPIDHIEPSDGEKFKAWHLQTHRSKTTANIHLRSVKATLTWAVQTKRLLAVHPLKPIKEFKVTRKPVRIYEDYQVARMLRFAPSLQWKGILLTAWTTGLRRGAILNLTLDNIRNGFVFVEPKHNTARTWEWEPKDKEQRKVPLVPELAEYYKQLPCHYPHLTPKQYARLLSLKDAGFLKEELRKCPLENFRRTFVGIQRSAFGRQIGDFHMLRKTFTTNMCGRLPEHFVMRLTGHSNLKTMTYYLASRESYYVQASKIAQDAIKNGGVQLLGHPGIGPNLCQL